MYLITRFKKAIFISLLLPISLYVSCGFFTPAVPRLLQSLPVDGAVYNSPAAAPREVLLFTSVPMDRASCLDNITLKRIQIEGFDETAVSGEFFFSAGGEYGMEIAFRPHEPLSWGRYRLSAGAALEDSAGVNIEAGTNILFEIGTSHGAPCLLSVLPAAGTVLTNRMETLVFNFDKPMDTAAFPRHFTCEPFFRYECLSSNGGKSALVRPLEVIPPGELKIRISGAVDMYGLALPEEKVFHYTSGGDNTPPVLTGLSTNGGTQVLPGFDHTVDKTASFTLLFSENLSPAADNPPVTFTPAVPGCWKTASNTLTFMPSAPLSIGTAVIMSVKPGIKDMAGNASTNDARFTIMIGGPRSQFLNLLTVTGPNGVWDAAAMNQLSNTNTAALDFVFSRSLVEARALDNVFSVQYVTGGGPVSVSVSNIELLTTSLAHDTVRLSVKGLSAGNVYRFSVKGGRTGILDTLSNWTTNDMHFFCRVEY